VCTRWVRLLKALASSMTRIGLPSLHDLGANLIPGDPSGWEPHDRAECLPPFLGPDREGTHYPRSRHGLHDRRFAQLGRDILDDIEEACDEMAIVVVGLPVMKTAPTYHTPGRPLGDAPACHVSPVAILSPLCQDMRLR